MSCLFAGIRQNSGYIPLTYNLIQLIRRLVFVIVAVHIHKAPWIQSLCFMIASLLVNIYLLNTLPFDSFSQNLLEVVNEILVLVCAYSMAVSCGWNLSPDHRLKLGVSTVVLTLFVINYNVIRWLCYVVKYVRLNWKWAYGKCRVKMQIRRK